MADEIKKNEELEALKDTTGKFVKATGDLLGAAGKFAVKLGTDAKEKIEDPEFQAQIKGAAEAVKEKAVEITDKAVETVKSSSKIIADNAIEEAEKHANEPQTVTDVEVIAEEEPADEEEEPAEQ